MSTRILDLSQNEGTWAMKEQNQTCAKKNRAKNQEYNLQLTLLRNSSAEKMEKNEKRASPPWKSRRPSSSSSLSQLMDKGSPQSQVP